VVEDEDEEAVSVGKVGDEEGEGRCQPNAWHIVAAAVLSW